ncbi:MULTISPECIES: FtsX-like permease family protein [Pseudomonas]|uniref:Membrane protein n=1 Tax=Pseudomonas fulva TaxID=47880 RepID=A0A0D0L6I7_9PSED|nr:MULTISPECIES: FtsX-like permease family protein [Pseudomonas]KIQ05365.1 membrane protein [Pseudomonas fulva]
MRLALFARLAWQDYRCDARLSWCAILALAAVIAPLLVLFGLKFGLVTTLTERLERDPGVREVIPLGGARYSLQAIEALARRDDVAFVIPRTRQIAATAELQGAGQAITVEMLPTAVGDPLLGALPAPASRDAVLLSQSAAEKLGVTAGDTLEAGFGRTVQGAPQYARARLQVQAVLPLAAFSRDALFAALPLLEAVEDYRDGLAVADFGWPGAQATARSERVYPGFRLYARDLDGVESLRLHFQQARQAVVTQAEAVAQVRTLSRNLAWIFWSVACLSLAGAFAALTASTLGAVERKRHELAVLRLLGFPAAALVAFVVLQALYTGIASLLLSALLYGIAASGLNLLFQSASGEYACRLLFSHYLLAALATLLCCMLAAAAGGWRAAYLEASEGLRHV